MNVNSKTSDDTTSDGKNKPSVKAEETTAENQGTALDLDNGEIRSGFVCGIPV